VKPGLSNPHSTLASAAVPMIAILMGLLAGCRPPSPAAASRSTLAPAPVLEEVRQLITVGPPPIPVQEQPACPDNGYLWTPGFWARGAEGYSWVAGTWVLAPAFGLLWTPGYWGWSGQTFVFHPGYWGPRVGFYGGINYGHGYGGHGFTGGRWQGRNYSYNRSITSVNVALITNVYYERVDSDDRVRVAYNGGEGGTLATPTPQERAAELERYTPLAAPQADRLLPTNPDTRVLASSRGAPTAPPEQPSSGAA